MIHDSLLISLQRDTSYHIPTASERNKYTIAGTRQQQELEKARAFAEEKAQGLKQNKCGFGQPRGCLCDIEG